MRRGIRRGVGALAALIAALAAAPAAAQAGPIDGQPAPQEPEQRNPGVSVGGIGFSFSLRGARKPKPPAVVPPSDVAAASPPLEMRDATLADALPDQVIFLLGSGATGADAIARRAGVVIIETAALSEAQLTMVVAKLARTDTVAAAQARLERVAGVLWAQPNHQYQLLGQSVPKRFALHQIPEKQPTIAGRIAMIDAPVDLGHANLAGAKVTQTVFGVDPAPAVHGTVVAALLVGTGAYPGTAQGAMLTSLAAFGSPAAAVAALSRTAWLARAMNEALRLRPGVLNLSFGGPEDRLLSTLLDAIRKQGVCVSAAAGNGGPQGRVLFPAAHPASLAVTAVDENLRGYAFASRGERVDVAGVGVDLNAAVPGGRRAVSGTSFATAVISGALLRMPACNGGRDPDGMKAQVAAAAQDLGPLGRDSVFGAGLFRLMGQNGKKKQ